MTDQFDRASEYEQIERDALIAERRAAFELAAAQPSAEFCFDCADPIPDARRRAVPGVRFCVDCQGFNS